MSAYNGNRFERLIAERAPELLPKDGSITGAELTRYFMNRDRLLCEALGLPLPAGTDPVGETEDRIAAEILARDWYSPMSRRGS